MAGNKNVLSCDLENEGQGYHLQKLLYLTYNTNVFVAATKMSNQQRQSCAATPCRVAHFVEPITRIIVCKTLLKM